MAVAAILKNPTRPEVVFNGQTVAGTGPYIVFKSNRKSDNASLFMWFRHISTSGLATNGCRWPIFAGNMRI